MLRDDIENVLRGWHIYEATRPDPIEVIDFDCLSSAETSPVKIESRLHAYRLLLDLREEAAAMPLLLQRLDADLTYLASLMGQAFSLGDYVALTQGCGTAGWPTEYVEARGEVARAALAELGIPWDETAQTKMDEIEGLIDAGDAADTIRSAAEELEPTVREAVNTHVQFPLVIENVDVDEYWDYWLDGDRDQVRLRLNMNKAKFTKTQARQMAMHEVLGHALQFTSIAQASGGNDVPWVRVFSVHAPTQVLFEGLAQALPLLVTPDDKGVTARVRLLHYLQLVRAELHLAINAGASIGDCIRHAKERAPFWQDNHIVRLLVDRSSNPLLRSYLWAYPAGCDWFVNLIDTDRSLASKLARLAYRSPLTPTELAAAWPEGPPVGGPGEGTV